MEYKKLTKILDHQASTLVGILSKRIEVLESEGDRTNTVVLTPSLYKKLVKELVYERFRAIKEVLKVHYSVGKVVFKSKGEK